MQKKIGFALGSGAARGVCHFGVIKALAERNIKPEVICGTSVGALVAAAYVTGHFEDLENWFLEQTNRKFLSHLDINLFAAGGIADGEKFIKFLKTEFGDYKIEDLSMPYAAVACDMTTGKEVWITEGSIWDAVRASGAYPGLMSPVKIKGQWLLDGGVVNPVPVTLCRALGASHVVAVNLNHDLLAPKPDKSESRKPIFDLEHSLLGKMSGKIKNALNNKILPFGGDEKKDEPGILEVISYTINIMQDRITRSRLAGDPADVTFHPRLGHIGLLEVEKSKEAIEEGFQVVKRHEEQINYLELD